MSSTPTIIVPPTSFPTVVKIEFSFEVNRFEDYEYLVTPVQENSIASDAAELFEQIDLKCVEVNGIKL